MPNLHLPLLTCISCMAVLLAQLGMMMYLPALPLIAQSLNTTPSLASLSLPVYLLGMALPMLLWGKWGAAWGIKPVLIASLLLFSASSLLLTFCAQLESFLTLRCVQGVGASGMSVMARSLVAQHFKGDTLAKALAWLSIAFVVSLGIGQFFGAVLISAFGWPTTFWCLAIGAIIHAGVVYRHLPDFNPANNTPARWRHYLTIVRHAGFLRPALTGGLGWAISLAYVLGSLSVNRYMLSRGQSQLSAIATSIMVLAGIVMLLGVISDPTLAGLLWLPYCFIVFGQAINYPVSLSEASGNSPVDGPYSMALCGLIHQLVAACVGVIISLIGVHNPLYLAIICLLLAAAVRGLNIIKPTP